MKHFIQIPNGDQFEIEQPCRLFMSQSDMKFSRLEFEDGSFELAFAHGPIEVWLNGELHYFLWSHEVKPSRWWKDYR